MARLRKPEGGVMSKRAPELVELQTYGPRVKWSPAHGEYPWMVRVLAPDGAWVESEAAEAAIRSLRVKLHRERAHWHMVQGSLAAFCAQTEPLYDWSPIVRRHEKAAARFKSRAEKIEKGEL